LSFIANIGDFMYYLGNLFVEAAVVGVICLIFLILFVVAGIRQIIREQDE